MSDGRVGFLQLMFDSKTSWWEARSINAAHDAADIAAAEAQAAHFSIAETNRRVAEMARELLMMRTALTVVTKTLLDTNVVDGQVLAARLDAAMEEAFPPPPPPMAKVDAGLRPVVCIRCHQSKPAQQTTLTGDGPICDSCTR